jgi:hypothetical protein
MHNIVAKYLSNHRDWADALDFVASAFNNTVGKQRRLIQFDSKFIQNTTVATVGLN